MKNIKLIYGDNVRRYKMSVNELFAGNFMQHENKVSEYTIYELDDFDINYTKHVPLRVGEKIFRCDTERSRSIGKYFGQYLVKVNLEKGLVYFLEDSDDVNVHEKVFFQKKGCRITYMNILEKHLENSKQLLS